MAAVTLGTSLTSMCEVCDVWHQLTALSSSTTCTHGANIKPQNLCRTMGLPFFLYICFLFRSCFNQQLKFK